MVSKPLLGARDLLTGLGLIFRPGLRRFVILPLGINVLVFGLLIGLLADEFGLLMHWLISHLPSWLAWLQILFWLLFGLLTALLFFFAFSIVANLIAAPFNSVLAEAVEKHLTGRAPPAGLGLGQALKEAPQAIVDELGKIGYWAMWALPLLLLFVIPLVNLAAPFLWGLFSAWMLAVEYADYPMGNHAMAGRQQRQRLREHRLSALGFGGATLLATMTPLFNFVVMPAAVAGATAMWVRELKGNEG